jgi:hypothetical protein
MAWNPPKTFSERIEIIKKAAARTIEKAEKAAAQPEFTEQDDAREDASNLVDEERDLLGFHDHVDSHGHERVYEHDGANGDPIPGDGNGDNNNADTNLVGFGNNQDGDYLMNPSSTQPYTPSNMSTSFVNVSASNALSVNGATGSNSVTGSVTDGYMHMDDINHNMATTKQSLLSTNNTNNMTITNRNRRSLLQAEANNASGYSAYKTHTHTSTLLTHSYLAKPVNGLSLGARDVTQAFKTERNGLIKDLSELWKQIDFLTVELNKANTKNGKLSASNRKTIDALRSKMEDQDAELEDLRKSSDNDANMIMQLTREVSFGEAEKRGLRHLANTKKLDERKITERTAKLTATKLTNMTRDKNRSDARGDDLAASIIELKREHTAREGNLLNTIADRDAEITVLKAENGAKEVARTSAAARCDDNLRKNDAMVSEISALKEECRVKARVKARDDEEIARLSHRLEQEAIAKEREHKEWRDRCIKAEADSQKSAMSLTAREKELDRLRERLSTAINDAEGEVSVSRAEAEALKERCIALSEQNEALIDRYREAEVILRKEGIRFDSTMKRLVTEMRDKSSLSNSFLEERHLLNKQWEKREKEIVAALKREARRVELKEEDCVRLREEIDELKDKIKRLEAPRGGPSQGGRFGGAGGYTTEDMALIERTSRPELPSVMETRNNRLETENASLRKENERLLNGMLEAREAGGSPIMQMQSVSGGSLRSVLKVGGGAQREGGAVGGVHGGADGGAADDADRSMESVDRSADSGTDQSTSTVAEASKLYAEFKGGGTVRMASEVRNMVSESGKLLRRIEEYESLRRERGGGDAAANTPGGDSVRTTDFKSPYLFE